MYLNEEEDSLLDDEIKLFKNWQFNDLTIFLYD